MSSGKASLTEDRKGPGRKTLNTPSPTHPSCTDSQQLREDIDQHDDDDEPYQKRDYLVHHCPFPVVSIFVIRVLSTHKATRLYVPLLVVTWGNASRERCVDHPDSPKNLLKPTAVEGAHTGNVVGPTRAKRPLPRRRITKTGAGKKGQQSRP